MVASGASLRCAFTVILLIAVIALCGNFYAHHACESPHRVLQPNFRSMRAVGIENDHSSAPCSAGADLVIGVLASSSNRSINARRMIRKSWMTMPTGDTNIVVRFILARDVNGNILPEQKTENHRYKDLVFVNTHDSYKNLARKVQLFFRWAVHQCSITPFIMKTDDDVFIHLGRLARKLKDLPKTQLYWGRMMRHVDARKLGRPLPDNYQALSQWPHYASGAGYVLSRDVARAVGESPLAPQFFEDEDRAVGIALFGFNITYLDDETSFRPWGHCIPEAILLHYQRMPELLERRWRRAVAGQNICGVPFTKSEVCTKARQGHNATWECRHGKKITAILGATYGRVYSSGTEGSCGEGVEGLEPLTWCHAPNSIEIMKRECLGKVSCSVAAENRVFGVDPCKGETKHLLAAVRCG